MNVVDALFGIGTVRIASLRLRFRVSQVAFRLALLRAAPAERDWLHAMAELTYRKFNTTWLALRWTAATRRASSPRSFFARLREPPLPPEASVRRVFQDHVFLEQRSASS